MQKFSFVMILTVWTQYTLENIYTFDAVSTSSMSTHAPEIVAWDGHTISEHVSKFLHTVSLFCFWKINKQKERKGCSYYKRKWLKENHSRLRLWKQQ